MLKIIARATDRVKIRISIHIIGRAEVGLMKTIETWRGGKGWGLRYGVMVRGKS